ncbi:hypothetical protein E4U14_002204 [Claviceps sp. LM454 group G7]|nr:hypothetical protein E4U14_002204 [Claviceps sp. LM454 group G7]
MTTSWQPVSHRAKEEEGLFRPPSSDGARTRPKEPVTTDQLDHWTKPSLSQQEQVLPSPKRLFSLLVQVQVPTN